MKNGADEGEERISLSVSLISRQQTAGVNPLCKEVNFKKEEEQATLEQAAAALSPTD